MEPTINRLKFETQLWSEGYQKVMGLDEVGRGCLAGPVVAAGVIFKPGTNIPEIRDSKSLPLKERIELAEVIKRESLCWTVQEGSIDEVNRLNILWASIKAMNKCAEKATHSPDYLLVDGNRFTASVIPHTCIVEGDDKSISIGAASILAKVYRDEYMKNLHAEYPEFGWDTNVGYPTPVHRKALKKFGYTSYHRNTFKLGTQKKYAKAN